MNVELRKKHKRNWIGLTIVLSILIARGLDAIPENPIEEIPIVVCPIGMATCGSDHSEYDPDDVFVWHLDEVNGSYHLQVDLVKPIKAAFANVLLTHKTNDMGLFPMLIGQVGEMGSYEFVIPMDSIAVTENILVKDYITDRVFDAQSLDELLK